MWRGRPRPRFLILILNLFCVVILSAVDVSEASGHGVEGSLLSMRNLRLRGIFHDNVSRCAPPGPRHTKAETTVEERPFRTASATQNVRDFSPYVSRQAQVYGSDPESARDDE